MKDKTTQQKPILRYNILQVGDPLEKAALKGIDWSYKSDENAVPDK